jgi:hypothetical protein
VDPILELVKLALEYVGKVYKQGTSIWDDQAYRHYRNFLVDIAVSMVKVNGTKQDLQKRIKAFGDAFASPNKINLWEAIQEQLPDVIKALSDLIDRLVAARAYFLEAIGIDKASNLEEQIKEQKQQYIDLGSFQMPASIVDLSKFQNIAKRLEDLLSLVKENEAALNAIIARRPPSGQG